MATSPIPNKREFYIYVHRRQTDGRVFYVGKGRAGRLNDLANRNRYWHNIVNKHGFTAEKVSGQMPEACALTYEKALIAAIGRENLCNMTSGGDGKLGYICSEETKAKISAGNRGKKLTEEHKRKVGKAMKGRKVSDETRAKMSANNAFRRPDVIKRISEANKIPIIRSDGARFDSAADAERWAYSVGLTKSKVSSSVSACLKGRQATAYGFGWRYA